MAVHIRLRRIGKKAKARMHFRVSVFDSRRGRDAKCIEELGFYNPVNKQFKLNKERVQHWLRHGARLSNTVKSLLKNMERGEKDASGTSS